MQLKTIAVTGTNGKTSTTTMIASIIRAAGEVDVRGTTLGLWVGERFVSAERTWEAFSRAVDIGVEAGAEHLALEVTSKALANGFAERWPPEVAVLTNLGRDHLDRHGTQEAYLAAKSRLFFALGDGGIAVLNAADAGCGLLNEVLPASTRRLGFASRAPSTGIPVSLQAAGIEASASGLKVHLAGPLAAALGESFELPVAGHFQVDNALAAAVAASAAGFSADAIQQGLHQFTGARGRFERVTLAPLVVVDYAHTPDALAAALGSARQLVEGRVVVVFGCGGERDQAKRPLMGQVADELADEVWLTTDNPRSEDPSHIADAIMAGATGNADWRREPDRAAAIGAAIASARASDAVVIAGKGHESTQESQSEARAFDDLEHARQACIQVGHSLFGA